MLELFQTEWCPASRRVRQRLTELGLDYVNRQVPVEREARTALRELTGADTIPVLRLENGSVIVGEESVLAYLGEHIAESPNAESHRRKAAKARRRYLEEECECPHNWLYEREPYTILGACNPPLAHEALEAEPDLGVLLPCNVIVYRSEGRTHVSAVDAERMLSIVGSEQLAPIATEVTRRLADVVTRTAGKAATHATG